MWLSLVKGMERKKKPGKKLYFFWGRKSSAAVGFLWLYLWLGCNLWSLAFVRCLPNTYQSPPVCVLVFCSTPTVWGNLGDSRRPGQRGPRSLPTNHPLSFSPNIHFICLTPTHKPQNTDGTFIFTHWWLYKAILSFPQRVFFFCREIIQYIYQISTLCQKYHVGPYGRWPGVPLLHLGHGYQTMSGGPMVFLFLLCTNVISHLLASLFQFRARRQQPGLPVLFAKPRVRPSRPHRPSGGNGPANERDDSHRQLRSYHPESTRDVAGKIPHHNTSSHDNTRNLSMNPRSSSGSVVCGARTRHLNKLCWRCAGARLWTASVYLNWFHKYALISCGGGRRWTRPPEPFWHLSCIFTPYLAPRNQIAACLPLWFPSGAEKPANKPKKNNNSPKQPAWHQWWRATFRGRLKVKMRCLSENPLIKSI